MTIDTDFNRDDNIYSTKKQSKSVILARLKKANTDLACRSGAKYWVNIVYNTHKTTWSNGKPTTRRRLTIVNYAIVQVSRGINDKMFFVKILEGSEIEDGRRWWHMPCSIAIDRVIRTDLYTPTKDERAREAIQESADRERQEWGRRNPSIGPQD